MPELANLRWIGLAVLLVDVVALVTIWSSRRHSMKARILWTVLVAVLPIVGAIGWAALGREPRRG